MPRAARRTRPKPPPRCRVGCSQRSLSLREGSIIIVTIVVAIYFSANTSTFFTGDNFKTLLPYFAPLAILGAGEVFVMILGEIDLSIGAMYMFAPIVFYKLDTAGLGLVASAIIALLICMVVGAVNGAFVAIVGVNSFVTTLGMLFTFEGLSLILSHGTPVATPGAQVTQSVHQGAPRRQRAQHRAPGNGQPCRHVRENLRRRRLLRADLGGGDRGGAAGGADVHALGPVHGRDRLQQAGRGGGGREGQAGHDPELRAVRARRPGSSACSRRSDRRRSSPTRRDPTNCC